MFGIEIAFVSIRFNDWPTSNYYELTECWQSLKNQFLQIKSKLKELIMFQMFKTVTED